MARAQIVAELVDGDTSKITHRRPRGESCCLLFMETVFLLSV